MGKLTIGRELNELTGYVLIHDHLTIETATAVYPFAAPGFAELRSGLFSVLLDAACQTTRGIIVTHADDVFWVPPFANIISNCLTKHNYHMSRVLLRCSREEHERRIQDPARGQYQKITDIERLDRLTQAGEFSPAAVTAEDLVIDTSGQRPREVAHAIAHSLGMTERRAVGVF